jgi:RNA polymerase sigma factor (sigma-70 family)
LITEGFSNSLSKPIQGGHEKWHFEDLKMAEVPPCRSESSEQYSKSDPSTDESLQNSDHWVYFYRTLLRKANRFLPLYLRNKIGAEDLVQETMLVASQYQDQIEQRNLDEILSWLIVILRNRTKYAIRNVKATPRQKNIGLREVQADDILWNTLYTDESSLNSRFIKGEVILYMKIAMCRIPKDQRNLLVLRFNEERDLRWIAKKLRISERQVRRRVQNALESLKMEFHNASRK